MTTQPTELHVFDDGEDWYVAHDASDAAELRRVHYGEERPGELEKLSANKLIGILCDENGEPSDSGKGVDLAATEWAAKQGRGYLCSRDF